MSERIHKNEATQNLHETAESEARDHLERISNKLESESQKIENKEAETSLESIKERVEKNARSSEDMRQNSDKESETSKRTGHTKTDQDVSFSRTMIRIRKRLNNVEKPLSTFIHNPVVDKVSDVASQTIARPSSLLGGAFVSFLGTSILLWITKHYGYEYNYLAVILLFAIGMVSGLGIEAVIRAFKRRTN